MLTPIETFRKAVEHSERSGVLLTMTSDMARKVLDEVDELKRRAAVLAKEVTPQVGDVIREVGEEELTGEIIQIKEGPHEEGYLVKLYAPSKWSESIIYYRDEFEIMERAK